MTPRMQRWARYGIALLAHHTGMDFLYRRITGAGLVVLMLHRLRDEHDPYPLSLSRGSFAQIVNWLRQRKLLVGLEHGLRELDDPGSRALHYAITFDDGYRDNLGLVDPQLGPVPAVVYVVTGHVGGAPIWVYRLHHAVEMRTRDRLDLGMLGLGHFDVSDAGDRARLYAIVPPRLKQLDPQALDDAVDAVRAQLRPRREAAAGSDTGDMLDWPQIVDLAARGVEIGAHTRHHVMLSRVDAGTAGREIIGSRDDIGARLAEPPRHFAYPNGGVDDFSQRDVALVRDAGFHTAVTSIEGINRPGTDHFRILRHNVHEERFRAPQGTLSQALFFSETSGLLGWLRARRAA